MSIEAFPPATEERMPGEAFFEDNGLQELAGEIITYTDKEGTTHVATAQDAANECAPFRSQLEMLGGDLAAQVLGKMKATPEQAADYTQKKD